jgi:regulatory protein
MALRKKAAPLDPSALKDYAVRLLMGRALTTGELRRKLAARAAEPASVDEVIAKLKDYGYLDDARFAEHFAGARAGGGRYGAQRVLSDLLKKRIAPATARSAVTGAYAQVDETGQVEQFLERKYRGKDLPALFQDPRQLASAYRRLRTAGFASGPSIRVLKRFADAAGELEDFEE